jgi:8-oxo-dGTP diphosphatase
MTTERVSRARALIVQGGAVALIERRNSARGAHYYVFPGGGVEAHESPTQAAAREVAEELGLAVEIQGLVAEVSYGGDMQQFFRATVQGGTFGTGTGSEMTGTAALGAGTHTPIWMPLDEIPHHTIYPRDVATLVYNVATNGWPHGVHRYRDTE